MFLWGWSLFVLGFLAWSSTYFWSPILVFMPWFPFEIWLRSLFQYIPAPKRVDSRMKCGLCGFVSTHTLYALFWAILPYSCAWNTSFCSSLPIGSMFSKAGHQGKNERWVEESSQEDGDNYGSGVGGNLMTISHIFIFLPFILLSTPPCTYLIPLIHSSNPHFHNCIISSLKPPYLFLSLCLHILSHHLFSH